MVAGVVRHHVLVAADAVPVGVFADRSVGLARVELVGGHVGSVHMGLGLVVLERGHVDCHVHSHEESFYVLEGEPVLYLDGRGVALRAGACGVIPVGVAHAWRAGGLARWVDMRAPRPRDGDQPSDTFVLGPAPEDDPDELDIRDPRNRHLFVLTDADMDLDRLKSGASVAAPTVSASMATAALAYSGITVKMLVDQRTDAQLQTMFMVDYQPGAVAHPHDHPFEEAYYMLAGEIDVVADEHRYTLRPGDTFWTAVGCIHAFYETQNNHVRWLETSAPGPPNRHSYRFQRDWQYLEQQLRDGAGRQPTGDGARRVRAGSARSSDGATG
jgi:quercetin dioxygenase-like cupin family protein